MLKKFYLKKLLVCGMAIFTILLIYVIPANEDEKLKISEEVEYVNKDLDTSTIFLDDSNNYLGMTKIITNSKDTVSKAKELLEALIIDGTKQDSIPNGFKALIPSNTKIRSLTYDNKVIKVDFSSDLMNTNIENEEKIIEAIVYTLTSIEDVEFVIIYIEGELLTTLPQSKITLPSTLDRSFGINKEYNLNSTKDINKTTIYYISEFNDNQYYVPVTKVTNDERSKIEIIVDELSSSNVYKTNLMSYLNSNTKLLSVNENENELVVNFNSGIFNDINTEEILEEVIYTISMSINDNYSVNSVVFNVEDKEIYKSVLKSIE
ncbi:MAG: GerMN domain-containing protein [Bacilli bacterium]|nr:GerMN domain-containing protein [Bacilli bacterium]